MKMWTVYIRDQTAYSMQSDLDLHCPQKPLVSSTVRKKLKKEVQKIYSHLLSKAGTNCGSEMQRGDNSNSQPKYP